MPPVTHQVDAPPQPPPATLPCPRSAHSQLRAPIDVGDTGSIFSLVDREARNPSVDAASSFPDHHLWTLSGRSRSTGRFLLPKFAKQVSAAQHRLEAVGESQNKVPKWKRFLKKLRGDIKKGDESKGSKPTRPATSAIGKQQAVPESLRDKLSKGAASRDTEVSTISSTPRPLRQPREKPSSLLWERRSVAEVAPLDLTRLRRHKLPKAESSTL